jgi:hypothetical protein
VATLAHQQAERAFHEDTILAYAKAARALDPWMTDHDVDGDFTACDTALLNRFFRDYHDAHTRGGTNTKQRNLRHLFTWLEAEYDHWCSSRRPPRGRWPRTCGRGGTTGWLDHRPCGWGGATGARWTGRGYTGYCSGEPTRPATSPRCTRICSGTPSQTTGCLFWLDAPCLRAVVAEREQGVYRRFSSIPRCSPMRWGTKNASMPLLKSMVPEGVGDALNDRAAALGEAVRTVSPQPGAVAPGCG